MLIKLSRLLLIVLFLLSNSHAAMRKSIHHEKNIFLKDIKILEQTLKDKPGDIKTLTRLVKLTFSIEQLYKTKKYASQLLAIKKDKEIAYLNITTLITLGESKEAIIAIDNYLKTYDIAGTEKINFQKKKRLLTKQYSPKPDPGGLKPLSFGENKIAIALLNIDYNYCFMTQNNGYIILIQKC